MTEAPLIVKRSIDSLGYVATEGENGPCIERVWALESPEGFQLYRLATEPKFINFVEAMGHQPTRALADAQLREKVTGAVRKKSFGSEGAQTREVIYQF